MQHALRAFLNNLTFYETGELAVNFPDSQLTIRQLLPLDGKPWITARQARRIRKFETRRHSGPKEKYLFAGLPVTVDGQPGQLKGRALSKGRVHYYFDRSGERRALTSPRAGAIPPLPAAVIARWYAEALAALAYPLSLRLAERPADADPG